MNSPSNRGSRFRSRSKMIGAAADLWVDDEEFDRFVQGIYDRRLDQRGGGKSEP